MFPFPGSMISHPFQDVPEDKVSSYGIIDGNKVDDSLYCPDNIVEKPSAGMAPSNIGSIGRYVFTPDIFECIKRTGKGVGGEIQLTDAIRLLTELQKVYAYPFEGKRYDTGDKIGYMKTIIDFALRDEEIGEPVLDYLKGGY